VIASDRYSREIFHFSDQVEIGTSGFHHNEVRSFFDVTFDGSKSETTRAGRKLVTIGKRVRREKREEQREEIDRGRQTERKEEKEKKSREIPLSVSKGGRGVRCRSEWAVEAARKLGCVTDRTSESGSRRRERKRKRGRETELIDVADVTARNLLVRLYLITDTWSSL
jgi:hypothetical protein